jgi:choline dehydrogenase-like flavoprotein
VVGIGARMADPVEMWLGPTQAARSLQFWRPGPAGADGIGPAHGGFIIESAPPHPGLLASAFPWEGAARSAARMEQARFDAPLLAIIRDQGSGHVHWTRHRRARIDYRLGGADAGTARRALVELARLGHAAGAREIVAVVQPIVRWSRADGDGSFARLLQRLARTDTSSNRLSLFSAHQMGTVRAGAAPAAYPCDPWGRVRQDGSGRTIRGLVVADSSLFPSPSGVNPMLSVMVLAERSARTLRDGA